MKKDYYEILGVPKDAAAQDIKKKYRSAALKFHPDRVPEAEKKAAEEKFKEISEAYAVLSDPKKRQLYDQHGHAGIDQNFTAEDIFRGADFGDLGDILGQIFGGGDSPLGDIFGGGRSQRRGPARGRDIQYETDVTLEEAFKGVTKKIKVPRNEICQPCHGTGAKNGTALKTCDRCGGSGAMIVSSGFFRMQQTCSACGGRGKMIKEVCPDCSGKGHIRVTRNIDITIPAGVDNNSRLRVRNEGEVAEGGAGDLYLYIHVLPHNIFQRENNDLYLQLNISFVKAALSGEASVPTLDGNMTMKIPAGTESGKVFRLKGKGMPDVHNGYAGDLYVKVMLQVPKKLNGEQKKLLEEFAETLGEEVQPVKNDSISEKIKKVFK